MISLKMIFKEIFHFIFQLNNLGLWRLFALGNNLWRHRDINLMKIDGIAIFFTEAHHSKPKTQLGYKKLKYNEPTECVTTLEQLT